jgi:predicted ATPase
LAYLALHLDRHCPREELAEAIWPDEGDERAVANRLRVALASLRRQMEPSGVPFGSVIDVSMPGRVRLRGDSVRCDATDIDRAFRSGDPASAVPLMMGSLLPGFYEDWAVLERHRFEALAEGAPVEERSSAMPVSEPEPPEVETVRPSLPLYLTRFFGRERELEQVEGLLESHRLVCLTGPGGMGKTRLAVQAAARVSLDPIFVPLADLTSGEAVPDEVVRVLGARPSPSGDLLDQIASLLSHRHKPLLILDNAEHVLDGVASFVLAALQAVPTLGVLVTSRRRLDIAGERVVRLANLELPTEVEEGEARERTAAIALFVDRARNARPDFVLGERALPAVVEICRLLEGMPLAIELAAARVVAQSPTQIAETLRQGLIDLKSLQRGLSVRHRSLRASIAGSFDLLPGPARSFLTQLVAFHGGWTADAAQAITGEEQSAELLEELAERSLILITADPASDVIRYRFLETVRQFALEQLDSRQLAMLVVRHAQYYLRLASDVSEDDIGTLQPLEAEQENLVSALGAELDPTSELFPSALAGALTFAHVRGKHRTYRPYAELAAEIADAVPSVEQRVQLRVAAYFVLSYLGRADSVRALGEAMLEDSNRNGYADGAVVGQLVVGYAESLEGDPRRGLAIAMDALAQARRIGNQTLIWRSLRIASFLSVTVAQFDTSDTSDPVPMARQSEELSRECLRTLPDSSTHQTFELMNLHYALRAQERYEESYAVLKRAEAKAVAHGMESLMLFCVREECRKALRSGSFEQGALMLGASERLNAETGFTEVIHRDKDDFYRLLTAELGPERLEALLRQGRRMSSRDVAAQDV